jgi:hypothetical protein
MELTTEEVGQGIQAMKDGMRICASGTASELEEH